MWTVYWNRNLLDPARRTKNMLWSK